MPAYTLAGGYTVEKTRKLGDTQSARLKEQYNPNNHIIVINGIPANVDLSGNVQVLTYNISGSKNKNESEPDHMEICREDSKGNKSYVKLFREKDGTYRRQTEKEEKISEKMNLDGATKIAVTAAREASLRK